VIRTRGSVVVKALCYKPEGYYSASDRNEYQKHKNVSESKVLQVRRADNFATIFEPIVYTIWDSQHLTTL
jgi:hypothetical protein